jgi:alpha-tubulin suppressor-like RCC1 family protein
MTRKGVWNLQQVRDKYLQELWEYNVNLFSWGNNDAGQLGLNDKTNRSSPAQIPGGNWQISGTGNNESRNIAIMDSVYGIKSDGTLWAWGENTFGALGQNNQGNPTNQSSPIQIGSDTTWSSVGGGYRHGTAIKTDGTLWSWGYNYHGVLGQNNETHYSSPVQVGSDTNWSSVASGNVYTYGRKTDGTLWAWGNNGNGTLGQNSPQNANRSSPVQIPGTNWSEQYSSNQSTITAIKTDGTLWAWGRNYEGQLGQNQGHSQRNGASSPVQIPGSNWAILARGSSNRTRNPIAVKTDGTLWMWGSNSYGQLAQNDATPGYSSPVQVGTDTTWSTTIRPAGTGYGRWTSCIKSDNTLWVWGLNISGAFGVGEKPATVPSRSSPVQVPGTTWNEIYVTGNYSAFGIRPNLTPSQL